MALIVSEIIHSCAAATLPNTLLLEENTNIDDGS